MTLRPEGDEPRPEDVPAEMLGAGGLVSEAIDATEHEEERADPTPIGWLVWVYDHFAAIVTLVLLVAVTYSVAARALGHAVLGIVELGGYALVLMTLMAAAGLARRDGHVSVELIDFVVKKASALRIFEIVSALIQIAVTAVVLWASIRLTISDVEMDRGLSYGNEYLPRVYVSVFLPIGLSGLLVVLIARLVNLIRTPTVEQEEDV